MITNCQGFCEECDQNLHASDMSFTLWPIKDHLSYSQCLCSIKIMHKTIIWLTHFFSVHRPSHPRVFKFNEYGIMSRAITMRNVLGVCSGSLIIGFVSSVQTASAPLFTNWLKWMQLHNNKISFDAAQKLNEVFVIVFSLSVQWNMNKCWKNGCRLEKWHGGIGDGFLEQGQIQVQESLLHGTLYPTIQCAQLPCPV